MDDHQRNDEGEKDDDNYHPHHHDLTSSTNRDEADETDAHERSHSPPYSAGVHVDKLRINDFVRRVKRLRYFSQCLPIHSTLQGSPGSGSSLGTVVDCFASSASSQRNRKRSHSCPDLLQLNVSSWELRKDRLKEDNLRKEETAQAVAQQSVESQTEDLWPPTPYEHLFFSVLPPSLLFPPPSAPAESAPRPLAPSELLDRYIDAAFRNHERQTTLLGKPNASEDITLLKGLSSVFIIISLFAPSIS